MQAGKLNEIIAIYKPLSVITDFGELEDTYVFKLTTRANVNYISGNRVDMANEIFFEKNRNFIVRYFVDVVENDHIKYNGQNYRILSIIPDRQYQQKTIVTELINE